MKFKKTIVIIVCMLLLVMLATIIYPIILTNLHTSEFANLEQLGCDYMHPWEGIPKFRVLSYGSHYATVYYYAKTGGEKIKFAMAGSGWRYHETMLCWSLSGSADDYFVWPYYKNWVI